MTYSYIAQIQRKKYLAGRGTLTEKTKQNKKMILKEWQVSEKCSSFLGNKKRMKKTEVAFFLQEKIRLKTNTGKSKQNL